MIESLTADIEKFKADAARLAKEIAGHQADISAWTGDINAAKSARAQEKADFDKTHQDYSESIDALGRAIAVLKDQAYDRTQSSLLQVSALKSLSIIPDDAKRTIDAFLSQGFEEAGDGMSVTAPEANGYEFQSHGVIEMLEKLNDKFIDERTTLEREEANAKHAFTMLVQDLESQIE